MSKKISVSVSNSKTQKRGAGCEQQNVCTKTCCVDRQRRRFVCARVVLLYVRLRIHFRSVVAQLAQSDGQTELWQSRFARDGVLLLRQVLDRHAVQRARLCIERVRRSVLPMRALVASHIRSAAQRTRIVACSARNRGIGIGARCARTPQCVQSCEHAAARTGGGITAQVAAQSATLALHRVCVCVGVGVAWPLAVR